jgi:glycosyltransferase involved in cell wall biosynthesis
MEPDGAHPGRGAFVRDQVSALRELGDVEVELVEFPPGPRALAAAAPRLRRAGRFDVVHAHYGLTAWPCLAVRARVRALTVHGSDVHHPRTRLLTAAVLPRIDVVAAASAQLAAELPGAAARRRALVLPCGVELETFRPRPRDAARAQLGRDPGAPFLLFPADPARAEKRADRARAVAAACGAELVTLGATPRSELALWIAAASAVIVPSEREGFGLAVLEALACEIPVLATPVGIHADALAGLPDVLCEPFDVQHWSEMARVLVAQEPTVPGARASAERFGAPEMARRVLAAWHDALARRAAD